MRSILTTIFSMHLIIVSGQYDFTLNGIVPELLNNKMIVLKIEDNYSISRYRIIDSIKIINHQFTFKGQLKKPAEYATLSIKNNGFFYLALDSGNNTIIVKPLPPKWPLYKNLLSYSFVNNNSDKVFRPIDSLVNLFYLKYATPSKENKNILELTSERHAELTKKELDVIRNNPQNYYSLVALYKQSGKLKTNTDTLLQIFLSLDNDLKSSQLGEELKEKLIASTAVNIGRPIPDLSAFLPNRKPYSNKQLAGKIYLLAFGATWCAPCKENYPMLKKLYKTFKSNRFEILYVNLDEKTEKWLGDISKFELPWVNVSENIPWKESQIAKQFNISAIPLYILVQNDKIIYHSFQSRDDDNYSLLKKLLKDAFL